MKNIVRSKSDTKLFFLKDNLDVIHSNLKNFKLSKQPNKKESLGFQRKDSRDVSALQRKYSRKHTFRNSSFLRNSEASADEGICEENIELTFKTFLKSILRFKIEFDRSYFEKKIHKEKNLINLILEIISTKLNKIKQQCLTDQSNILEKELMQENFEKFERILDVIIKISPEDLFREVKSIILTEFDSTTLEIRNYLELNKNEATKLFSTMCQTILFVLSNISFELDYYSITINCLAEKLNRFFVEIVENSANSVHYIKSLDLVQKFIKVKKNFMKDFCDTKDKKFSFNRFSSFGRYFFNNIPTLIYESNFEEKEKPRYLSMFNSPEKSRSVNYSTHKTKTKFKNSNHQIFLWKQYKNCSFQESFEKRSLILFKLDKFFKLYFNTKLANWKYTLIKSDSVKKIEICRICEKTFDINNFILHIFYCKDERVNYQQINELRQDLNTTLIELRKYRDALINDKDNLKDHFFSPNAEFTLKFKSHILEKTPRFNSAKKMMFVDKSIPDFVNNKKVSEVEFLDRLIHTISKERDLISEYYEKYPTKLGQLISIVYFIVYIFCQNKNCQDYSQELNFIFSKLFINLMKKLILIETILTMQGNKEKAKRDMEIFKYKSNYTLNTLYNKEDSSAGNSSKIESITKDANSVGDFEKKNTNDDEILSTFYAKKEKSNPIFRRRDSHFKHNSVKVFTQKVDDTRMKFGLQRKNTTTKDNIFTKSKTTAAVDDSDDIQSSLNNLEINNNFLNPINKIGYSPSINNSGSCFKVANSPSLHSNSSQNNKIGSSHSINLFNKKNSFCQETPSSTFIFIRKDSPVEITDKFKIGGTPKSFAINAIKLPFMQAEEKTSPRERQIKAIKNELKNISEVKKISFPLRDEQTSIFNSNYLEGTNKEKENELDKEAEILISNFNKNFDSPMTVVSSSFRPHENESTRITGIISNSQSPKIHEDRANEIGIKKSLFDKRSSGDYKKEDFCSQNAHSSVTETSSEDEEDSEMSSFRGNKYKFRKNDIKFIFDENNEISQKEDVESQFGEIFELMEDMENSDSIHEVDAIPEDENYDINDDGMHGIEENPNPNTSKSIIKSIPTTPIIAGKSFRSPFRMNTLWGKGSTTAQMENSALTVKISDFKFISPIASGGYGRVDIYKKNTTGDLYAIKTVNINKMVKYLI